MDLRMPVIDGLAATRLIRKAGGKYETVPIMALSAGGPEMEEKALNAGCTRFFRKHKIEELIGAVEEILLKRGRSTDKRPTA